MDVLDAEGKLVSTIQKTYAPSGNAGACCRMLFEFKWVLLLVICHRWKPVQLGPYFAGNADLVISLLQRTRSPLPHTLQQLHPRVPSGRYRHSAHTTADRSPEYKHAAV